MTSALMAIVHEGASVDAAHAHIANGGQ